MAQHFAQAHHREFGAIVPGVKPDSSHLRPANADELCVRKTRTKFRDQSRAKQIAGGFSGNQREARRAWCRLVLLRLSFGQRTH
jgi:hypothetical protein